MAAVKQKLDIGAVLSPKQANALLRQFGYELLGREDALSKLYGGYSGSNYKALTTSGGVLLKLVHDTSEADVAVQVAALNHLRAAGFRRTAFPHPVVSAASLSYWVDAPTHGPGSFALVLDLLRGAPVDAMLAQWGKLEEQQRLLQGVDGGQGGGRAAWAAAKAQAALHEVGSLLAELHAVRLPPTGSSGQSFRTSTNGGACTCGAEIERELRRGGALAEESALGADPFVALLRARLPALHCLGGPDGGAAALPRSLLHGDPFLDNVIALDAEEAATAAACIGESSGVDSLELQGIVDWEDVCVGPRLFDVACAAIGGCFVPPGSAAEQQCLRDGSGVARSAAGGCLDIGRLEALLRGYQRKAKPLLCAAEREALVPAMQASLLCNAFFRFRKFMSGDKKPAAAAAGHSDEAVSEAPPLVDVHLELVERMLALDDAGVQDAVTSAMQRAASASQS